jgi:hypothetical protein
MPYSEKNRVNMFREIIPTVNQLFHHEELYHLYSKIAPKTPFVAKKPILRNILNLTHKNIDR